MHKALILAFFILAIIAGAYRVTHHPVYDCPSGQIGDKICTLTGYERNK
jgi:hypothetical protein